MKKQQIKTNLKKMWHYAKHYQLFFWTMIIFSVLITVSYAIMPIFYSGQIVKASASLLDELFWVALILLLIENCAMVFRFIIRTMTNKFYRKVIIDLQSDLLDETLNLSVNELDNNSSGMFIDRINNDTSDIVTNFTDMMETLMGFIARICILIVIFFVNKLVFVFSAITVLLFFIIHTKKIKIITQLEKEKRIIKEKNSGLISELVRGIRDIKLLNIKRNFLKKVTGRLDETLAKEYKISMTRRNYDTASWFLEDIAYFGLTIIMIYMIKDKSLAPSAAVLLYYYYFRIIDVIPQYSSLSEQLRKFDLACTRVFDVIDNNKYAKEVFGKIKTSKFIGDITFDKVGFSYHSDKPVLKEINLKIKSKETISFVGKSGSGKTTLFNLLTKLYEINQGSIYLDQININDLNEKSLRDHITVVTQNPYIFNFSIKDNLKIVNPRISNKEMIKACQKACLHDFILSLPDGYNTLIGEGGLMLSGGQRQRLAIARGLIKKSNIILFDEATSALDNETQEMINQAIKNLQNECTILIIAHRLSTVKHSDRIVIIDQGLILSEGTHQHLLETSHYYQKLYSEELVIDSK